MKTDPTQLESHLRQIHADQGGEATFADFLIAVADDPNEQGHAEARGYIGKLVIKGLKTAIAHMHSTEHAVYARNAQVDDLIHLNGQGRAVFRVVGRTQIDPPDNVEVELVNDPYAEAHFKSGDVSGGEWVCIVQS